MSRKRAGGTPPTTERRSSKRRKGRRMELSGHQALRIITENLGPEVAIFEASKNSWEAGATVLEFFPSDEGWLTLRDNGYGVAEGDLVSKMGNFGASGKKIANAANLGWGASLMLASKCPDGAVFTTWVEGSRGWAQNCHLGVDDNGDFALLEHGSKNEQVTKVRRPGITECGTQVVFTGIKFDADWLDLALGDHFLSFCGAQVHIYGSDPAYENCGEPRVVRSLVDRAVEARNTEIGPKTWGVFETPHARVTWVILAAESRSLSACYEAWNNEVLEQGDANKLFSWGPWAAGRRIVWICEAVQPDGESEIAPDLLRQMITGWNRKLARLETSAMLDRDPELELMRQFMTAFEDEHYDPAKETAQIQETNKRWRTGRSTLPSDSGDRELQTKEPGPGEEEGETSASDNGTKNGGSGGGTGFGGGTGGGGGGSNGGRRGKKKTPKTGVDLGDLRDSTTVVGEPEVRYSGKADLGNTPVRFVPRRNLIIINRDVGLVRDLLAEAKAGRKWMKTRELIGAHMVHGVVEFNNATGTMPDDNVMLGLILAPTAAINLVRGSSRTAPTKPATKKKAGKNSSN